MGATPPPLVFAALIGGCPAGADCIDYRDYLHWVASADTPDRAMAVALSGTYAYVTDHTFGLQVVDIANPQSPQIVGSVKTPGIALDVAVLEPCVHVADGSGGLQILPAQCPPPTPVASISDLQARAVERGIALAWFGGFDPELFDVFVHRRAAAGPWSCLTERPLADTGPSFEYVDGDAEPGVLYEYEVGLFAGDGTRLRFGPVSCQLPHDAGRPALSGTGPAKDGRSAATDRAVLR